MEELIRQINHFAEQAGIIEPDADRRRELLGAVNDYTERFLETLPERPAFIFTEDMGAGLYDSPIAEEGMEIEEILRIYKENVDDQALCAVSGKFFGYIAPCSMYYSALGDYMAAVMDEYAGEFASSPGAVRMEYQLLDWMAELVGYRPGAAKGVLASGGSIATLTLYRNGPGSPWPESGRLPAGRGVFHPLYPSLCRQVPAHRRPGRLCHARSGHRLRLSHGPGFPGGDDPRRPGSGT